MKKRVLLVLFMLISSLAMTTSLVYGGEYKTHTYNTNIQVTTDKKALVTEEIEVDFTVPQHGIYRYIPVKKHILYMDENNNLIGQGQIPIKIDNISIDKEKYKVRIVKANVLLKIGDPKVLISGRENYKISYTVNFFKDKADQSNVFYYNVIPHNWSSSIGKSKVVVTMPKTFNTQDLVVMSGFEGDEKSTNKVSWTVTGNTITITTIAPLDQGEGITLGIHLPEGYFQGVATTDGPTIWLLVVGVLSSLVFLGIWFKTGRDSKVIKTVEFYPPGTMTPPEIGYVIDGRVDHEDIMSLIVYMAQKGYLTIEEIEKGHVLHWAKDPDSDEKDYVKTLHKGLFDNRDSINPKNLTKEFYRTYVQVEYEITENYTELKGTELFKKNQGLYRKICYVLSFLFMSFFGLAANYLCQVETLIMGVITYFIMVMFWTGAYYGNLAGPRKYVGKGIKRSKDYITSIGFITISLVLTIVFTTLATSSIISAIGPLAMEITGYFAIRDMSCRSKYGKDILGKVLGFREFIKVADVERLRLLVKENPGYFYSMVPYAYVFGLAGPWASKFDFMEINRPSWYTGGNYVDYGFNLGAITSCMTSMSGDFKSNISTFINDSNYSSSSGGNFTSGGGFGGGSGGSW